MHRHKQKTIIGNWKMFKTLEQAQKDYDIFSKLILKELQSNNSANDARSNSSSNNGWQNVRVGFAVPALYLAELSKISTSPVKIYAQNSHWENEGAFTGEISPLMLKHVHAAGSLVGHSERRQMFGETNVTAGKRVGALLKSGLKAVLCIGETLQEREEGRLKQVLSAQITDALENANMKSSVDFLGSDPEEPRFMIAYEPVWAIGTGKSATPKEAQEAHTWVRDVLGDYFNYDFAENIPILYGGSVKSNNVSDFISCSQIDGALVGGASLDPQDFFKLCSQCINV